MQQHVPLLASAPPGHRRQPSPPPQRVLKGPYQPTTIQCDHCPRRFKLQTTLQAHQAAGYMDCQTCHRRICLDTHRTQAQEIARLRIPGDLHDRECSHSNRLNCSKCPLSFGSAEHRRYHEAICGTQGQDAPADGRASHSQAQAGPASFQRQRTNAQATASSANVQQPYSAEDARHAFSVQPQPPQPIQQYSHYVGLPTHYSTQPLTPAQVMPLCNCQPGYYPPHAMH